MSPPVAKAKLAQQFTLSVPTEEAGATTTTIELTVPSGFAIDSFEAEPGWTRAEHATGSGEQKTIQQVTWSGGKVPTDEDAVFRFNGSMNSSKTYTFKVRQTYSNGKVVDWTGSESSDTPAPTIEAVSSFRRLELDADHRRADRRRYRRAARDRRAGDQGAADRVRLGTLLTLAAAAALALPAAAWAHAGLVRTEPSASKTVNSPPARVLLSYTEPIEARFAIVSVTNASGNPGHVRAAAERARIAADADHLLAESARGLVPRLLARDLARTGTRCAGPSPSRSARTPGRRRSSACRRSARRRRRRGCSCRAGWCFSRCWPPSGSSC